MALAPWFWFYLSRPQYRAMTGLGGTALTQ